MNKAELKSILNIELAMGQDSLIAMMGEMTASIQKDIPAVMDELSLLNDVLSMDNILELSEPDTLKQDMPWICIKENVESFVVTISKPVPANELNLQSYWLTNKVPKAIQTYPTNLVLMFEVKNGHIYPEWFLLLFWGKVESHCLPVLTHYSMLEQEIGEWNLTALHRAIFYGFHLDALRTSFEEDLDITNI